MSETSRLPVSPLGQALGRVPSGLYILTVRWDGRETGMLASWVQQAGFDPPMVTVALKADGLVREWVERSGTFVLNQIAIGQKTLLRHFAHGSSADANAFEEQDIRLDLSSSAPVLSQALAFLEVRVVGGMDSSDHRLVLAEVVTGEVFEATAEPMVHVRRNGFHY